MTRMIANHMGVREILIKWLLIRCRYIAPLTITAYVYVKSSRELQTQEGPLAVAMFEARVKDSYSRHGSSTSNDAT